MISFNLNSNNLDAFNFRVDSQYSQYTIGQCDIYHQNSCISDIKAVVITPGSFLSRILSIPVIQQLVRVCCFQGYKKYTAETGDTFFIHEISQKAAIYRAHVIQQIDQRLEDERFSPRIIDKLMEVRTRLLQDITPFHEIVQNPQKAYVSIDEHEATGLYLKKESTQLECKLIVKKVGKGGFKTIWKAFNVTTQKKEALAFFQKTDPLHNLLWKRETEIFSFLKLRNIKKIIGLKSIQFGHNGVLVGSMKYCKETSFATYLSNHTDAQKVTIFKNIAQIISRLHEHGVVHGDIHKGNILVHKNQPYLADFGLSLWPYEKSWLQSVRKSIPILDDIINVFQENGRFGHDDWAFGVMLYSAFRKHGDFQSADLGYDDFVRRRFNGENVSAADYLRVENPILAQVIDGLLQKDPVDRISMANAAELLGVLEDMVEANL